MPIEKLCTNKESDSTKQELRWINKLNTKYRFDLNFYLRICFNCSLYAISS